MHDSHNFSRKIIIPRAIIQDPNVTQVIDIPANLAKAKNLVVSKTSTNKLVASALPDWKDELSGAEDDAPTNSLVATSISCSGYAPNTFQNATQPGGQAIQNVSLNATRNVSNARNLTSAAANATISRPGSANATFKAPDQSFRCPMTDYSNFEPVIASTFRSLTDLDSAQASPFDYSSSSGGFGTMDCSPSCSMDTAEFQKLMGGEYNRIVPMSQWSNEASSRQPDSFLGGGSYAGVGAYPCPQSPQNRSAPAALKTAARRQQDLFLGGGSYGGVGACPCPESPQNKSAPAALTTGSSKRQAANATVARQVTPNATFARSANATFARPGSANATFARSGAANATFKTPDQSFKAPMTDYSNFEPVIASTFRSLTDLDSAQASPFDYSSSSGGFGTTDCSPSCSMDTAEFQKLMGGEYNRIVPMSQWSNEASSRQPDSFLGGGSYGGVGAYPCPQSPQNRSAPAALKTAARRQQDLFLGGGSYGGVGAYPCPESPQNKSAPAALTTGSSKRQAANATVARQATPNATFARSANATFARPGSANATFARSGAANATFKAPDQSFKCPMSDYSDFEPVIASTFRSLTDLDSAQASPFDYSSSSGGFGTIDCSPSCSMDTAEFQKLMGGEYNRIIPMSQWSNEASSRQQDSFLGGGSYGGVGAYPCPQSPQNRSAPAAFRTDSSKRQASPARSASGSARSRSSSPQRSGNVAEAAMSGTFTQAANATYPGGSCPPCDAGTFSDEARSPQVQSASRSQSPQETNATRSEGICPPCDPGGTFIQPRSPQEVNATRSGGICQPCDAGGTFTQSRSSPAPNATRSGGPCLPCGAGGTFGLPGDRSRSPQPGGVTFTESTIKTGQFTCSPTCTGLPGGSLRYKNFVPIQASSPADFSSIEDSSDLTNLCWCPKNESGLSGDHSRSPQLGGVTFTESTIKTGQFTCSPTCTGLPGGSLRYKNFVPIQASSPADFSSIEDSSDLSNLCWCPKK